MPRRRWLQKAKTQRNRRKEEKEEEVEEEDAQEEDEKGEEEVMVEVVVEEEEVEAEEEVEEEKRPRLTDLICRTRHSFVKPGFLEDLPNSDFFSFLFFLLRFFIRSLLSSSLDAPGDFLPS